MYHYLPAGTGVAPTATAVNTTHRAWTSPSLGQLYGEPLVFASHVYVATENNTVYALVAKTGKVAWARHLGTPVPASALPCTGITPTVGITGTPVIDSSRNEIFVVAEVFAGRRTAHRLFGLSTATGRVELNEDVDPPGSDPSSQLQHTGLNLDAGQVVFGMGGNNGDCSDYRGRLVAVPVNGGKPKFFTVDAAPGELQGAIWMGGAAPVVDGKGHVWVETGNGSVMTSGHPYDDSDGLLELSSSLRLLQFFAPSTWPANNFADYDMSAAPALLSDGQVIVAGKSRIVYLVNGAHLGGIGHQQASLGGNGKLLGTACAADIDGGITAWGTIAYLPCDGTSVIAVLATKSPPGLRLLWTGAGGGPPIMAAGLIWTIGSSTLYGLNRKTGQIQQMAAIGGTYNNFPTPSVGDGLLLAPATTYVVAFAVSAPQ